MIDILIIAEATFEDRVRGIGAGRMRVLGMIKIDWWSEISSYLIKLYRKPTIGKKKKKRNPPREM